jgi:predicted nucleotidyltransferase
MSNNFGLTEKEIDVIKNIFKRYLDESYKIFIFGSRANGNFHFASDVDIAIIPFPI